MIKLGGGVKCSFKVRWRIFLEEDNRRDQPQEPCICENHSLSTLWSAADCRSYCKGCCTGRVGIWFQAVLQLHTSEADVGSDGSIRILEGLLTAILSDRTTIFGNPSRTGCVPACCGTFPTLMQLTVSRVLTGAGSSENTPLHAMITFSSAKCQLPSCGPSELWIVLRQPSAICRRFSG